MSTLIANALRHKPYRRRRVCLRFVYVVYVIKDLVIFYSLNLFSIFFSFGARMSPAHESLLNHASVLGVTCCHPMSGRYCAVGRELWLEYRAECVADGGRELMQMVRHQTPEWAEEIKRRVMALLNETSRAEK